MKITFVLPTYFSTPIGGYKVVYEYASRLSEAGHQVTIVFPRSFGSPGSSTLSDKLKDRVWPTAIRVRQLLRRQRLVNWTKLHPSIRLCLVGRFDADAVPDGDAVIATAWQTADAVSRLPAAKGRKSYLVQDYEVWGSTSQASVDSTFGLGMRVIVIASWLGEIAASCGATDVHVVPNGLDHSRFRVLTEPEARPVSILALFHTDERKGISVALDTLSEVHRLHPEVPITMFGVARRAARLPDWIRYVQLPSPDELVELYNSHSIFLSSSYVEGWCLPAAEAMACGCTFVGTDSKGPREFCESGVSALLSEPGDVSALVQNLQRVIVDPSLRREIQKNGTDRIRAFTWERSGQAFLRLLQEGREDRQPAPRVAAE